MKRMNVLLLLICMATAASAQLLFKNSLGNEIFRATQNYRVGIGVTAPAAKMHVHAAAPTDYAIYATQGYNYLKQPLVIGTAPQNFYQTSLLSLELETEDGPYMRINNLTTGELFTLGLSANSLKLTCPFNAIINMDYDNNETNERFIVACNSNNMDDPEYKLLMGIREDKLLWMGSGASCTTTGQWTNASSRSLKTDITHISSDEAAEIVMALEPVKFKYKTDLEQETAGFIAEDVPELVAAKGRKTLGTMGIVSALTRVVQEQQKAIAELQQQNKVLAEKMQSLQP